eukprot:767357-Hanusia_phi.AAC.4
MGLRPATFFLVAYILSVLSSSENRESCALPSSSRTLLPIIKLALYGDMRLSLRGGSSRDEQSGEPEKRKRLKKSKKAKAKEEDVKTVAKIKQSLAASSNTEETSISKAQEMRLQRLQKLSDQAVSSKMSPLTSAMYSKIEVLRTAMLSKDQKSISNIMAEIGEIARNHYAKKIWDVKKLETDGFAIGKSRKLKKLQSSLTAVSKNVIHYNGTGSVIRQIRQQAEPLCLPNPTDAVLGIDEVGQKSLTESI